MQFSEAEVPRLRIATLVAVVGLTAFALSARLVFWQVMEHHQLSSMASAQHDISLVIPAQRGSILSSDLSPVVYPQTRYTVVAYPNTVSPEGKAAMATQLAPLLSLSAAQLLSQLAPDVPYARLARHVSPTQAAKVRALQMPGLGLEVERGQSYVPGGTPGTTLAAHLLGYLDADGHGQYGVLGRYDSQLRGRDGLESSITDITGQQIQVFTRTASPAQDGKTLTLYLDRSIQFYAEQQLAQGVIASGGQSGNLIVMDPSTGGIVAWADYPSYDASHYAQAHSPGGGDPYADSNLASPYEPGSVMKTVAISSALDAGVVSPTTPISDQGFVDVGGYAITNFLYGQGLGNTNPTNILTYSSNVGAVEVVRMMPKAQWRDYLSRFGFGRVSGVDLAGEVANPLIPMDTWWDSAAATTAFGQGIAVTPIQMLNAVAAIANQGKLVRPQVVRTITDPDTGKVTTLPSQVADQAISPETAHAMLAMMMSVVAHGTGIKAQIPGYTIAGKTGTATIPVDGHYSEDVVASFAGIAPATHPRFVMLVTVTKPRGGAHGADVSAPIFQKVASYILAQWQVPPQ